MPELRCVLWDFGDTLADEKFLWRPSPAVPGWSSAYDAVSRQFGAAWDRGDISSTEFVAVLSERLGVRHSTVSKEIEARWRSIKFFELPAMLVSSCRLPQALVTLNPDGFSEFAVPRYEILRRFDQIVTSSAERTIDKVQLCRVAIDRLATDIAPAQALLIDNVSSNVRAWRAAGGRGFLFRDEPGLRDALRSELQDLAAICSTPAV